MMNPIFTDEQLNNMSRENMMEVIKIMRDQVQKKNTKIQLLEEKQKELEFMNAMLSDRLVLANRHLYDIQAILVTCLCKLSQLSKEFTDIKWNRLTNMNQIIIGFLHALFCHQFLFV